MATFDVSIKANLVEVQNALAQVKKEIANRFDFKGTCAEVTSSDNEIICIGENEFQINQITEIIFTKFGKRGVDARILNPRDMNKSANDKIKRIIDIANGISTDDAKKIGNERAKIIKAISVIEAGKVAYNKLKAFEKTVLLSLMLTECSRIDGKISSDDLALLKNIFSDQFNISSNVMTAVIEKKLNYSITKKVEQVEVYREKYELVEFLWEKILSSESEINDNEMTLIRKWVRRLDISDVESEGARKEVEANLNP